MSESQGRARPGTDGEPVAHARADASTTADATADAAVGAAVEELQPLAVSTPRVVLWGELAWVVALAVILAVPSLHEGERDWWPWVPVAGLVLGLIGFSYVRRGRGNAAGAH
jgi:hypothetical protein